MNLKECSSLLIWCGALNDIAEIVEKNKQVGSARQIRDIQKKIEDLALKKFPELREPFVT